MTYNRNSSITQLTRWSAFYARADSLFYGYNGNRLSSITDFGTTINYSGYFEFKSHKVSSTYTYNGAGDLTQDGNKGLTLIQYDYLGHPVRVQFSDGSCTEYVYAADGRKLREKHTTAVEGLSVAMWSVLQLTPAQTMAVDSMDYADNLRYRRQHIDSTHDAFCLDYHFDGGYLSATPTTSGSSYNKTLHFFICDHQGNIRLVVDGSDNIKQTNEYFPYGGPWGGSTDQGFQPYKYNGKELDCVHGLDWYDYGARRYDPAYCLFTQMDPLAEKYPYLSPYVYCAGNPVNAIDPDGKLVIFINGMHAGNGGSANYWQGLDKQIMQRTGDTKLKYYDGSIGGAINTIVNNVFNSNLNPIVRHKNGFKRGYKDAASIIESLEKGETIKLVTHSMGAAFGKGFIRGLRKYTEKNNIDISSIIEYEIDLAPYQPESQKADKDVHTITISHLWDGVAGFRPMSRAENHITRYDKFSINPIKEHSLNSFIINEIEMYLPQ